ncbi:MAG: M1 family metallopeptidase, partial [Candidatus Saccharimonadales bacterium]
MSKSVKRLYSDFKPQKYLLDISLNPDKMSFSGSVTIIGKKTGRPSQRLTFHQNRLTITEARVTKHGKKDDAGITVDRINHHSTYDEVRLHTKDMVYPGEYTICLKFKGEITRQMNGVYPCFFEQDGQQKKLIATQFESHHAREVFPCIDEPEAKAIFELSIAHPTEHTVLSNTPVQSSEPAKSKDSIGQTLTKFEPTPHMSTYLLAFVTGELGFKEAKTKDGVLVRAYATPDNVGFTDFGLEVAVKCLEFYNDYFEIDYPLDKCDLIALPDFASGAMENWGCITFREQCLLVDPKNTTLGTKQYVAMVVAHELAHQWFGNLVTMRWWTDLWLNEGFASWIEYLAIDHLFPEWDMWSQFAIDEQQQALKLDALEHTHPIEVAIHHPDEIRTIFDAISYSKGASVIHMLHEYLGRKDFQAGLRHYLKAHSYGNTDTVDLWASLEVVSDKPVKKFMHAWTSQPGFPLLQANVEPDSVNLEQHRFYANPLHEKSKRTLWPIPLLAGESLPDTLETASINQTVADSNQLKLNRGQSGFYRTAYNASHIERLGELIKRGKLSPLDRLGVLTDLFETAKAGHTDTGEALHFLANFSNEDSYPVWGTIASSIGSLRAVMDDEELRDDMKPYIRKLVAPQLERLGWDHKESDSHFDRLLRPIIVGLAASADEPKIVSKCQDLFKQV